MIVEWGYQYQLLCQGLAVKYIQFPRSTFGVEISHLYTFTILCKYVYIYIHIYLNRAVVIVRCVLIDI